MNNGQGSNYGAEAFADQMRQTLNEEARRMKQDRNGARQFTAADILGRLHEQGQAGRLGGSDEFEAQMPVEDLVPVVEVCKEGHLHADGLAMAAQFDFLAEDLLEMFSSIKLSRQPNKRDVFHLTENRIAVIELGLKLVQAKARKDALRFGKYMNQQEREQRESQERMFDTIENNWDRGYEQAEKDYKVGAHAETASIDPHENPPEPAQNDYVQLAEGHPENEQPV